MKVSLNLTLGGGWFCTANGAHMFCAPTFRQYFALGGVRRFTLVCSTVKPRGQNYYIVRRKCNWWQFNDPSYMGHSESPWVSKVDAWAFGVFGRASRNIYVWVLA